MDELRRAYGKPSKTVKEVKQAFEEGKDFEFTSMFHQGGRYCSISDFQKGETVLLRFNGDRGVTAYKIKDNKPKQKVVVAPVADPDGKGTVTIHQTWEQLKKGMSEGVWFPKCTCGTEREMELDASGYVCEGCGSKVKLVSQI